MPELPEVETVRRGLAVGLLGKEITDVSVSPQAMLAGDPNDITGREVISVRRFGKGLVIDFSGGMSLAAHLKMTGQFVFGAKSTSDLPHKHTHVTFLLSDSNSLFYNDIRRFGWLRVVKTAEIGAIPFFKSLGKEPLRDLTQKDLKILLKKSKAPIKSFLMSQDKIAGLGNIYASEALFLAKIHPTRPASSLSSKEAGRLFTAIEDVLKRAIAKGGSSRENFVNTKGRQGSYQKHFLVYDQTGKPCPVCKTAIEMLRIAGRSTFFCPTCQTSSA